LQFVDVLTTTWDEGLNTDVIYTDFQKAFDSVSHTRLLHKLKGYGIRDPLLGWIRDFLSTRKQQVSVNGFLSELMDVVSGVPQGSVLGPLLFLLYINDILTHMQSRVLLFADDMKLFRPIAGLHDAILLQSDLIYLHNWTTTWLLKLNSSKCKHLSIGVDTTDQFSRYSIGPNTLELSVQERDLGVLVDSKLSFDTHIATIVKKANRVLGLIRQHFSHLDAHCFLLLYKSMVRSILEYAQSVWSPHLKKHITAIEKVQKRATKILPILKRLPYAKRLAALNLPSLVFRRLRGDMIETYKILHGFYDASCVPILQLATNSITRGHSFKLYKPSVCSGVRAHSFACRIVNPWNSLPEYVATAPSLNCFKNRIDKHWSKLEIRFNYEADCLLCKD
jgi:hypothetical protein